MIEFIAKKDFRRKKIPTVYPALIEYETDFRIMINNEVYFEEPNFPLFEFVKYTKEWLKRPELPFEYCSIETEDNPLIVFYHKNENVGFFSPWQKSNCDDVFSKNELIDAINILLAKAI